MKVCSKCGLEKPLDEFNTHSSRGTQHYCKLCGKARAKADYENNKERYYAHAKRRDQAMREKIRELKSVPCTDCKQTFDPVCMDFDHLPGFEKLDKVSTMIRRRMAWSKIEAEIAKCEVVCANCHRLRTRDRLEVV